MQLHQEWMTDNGLFGNDFTKNYELQLAKDRFDNQRYHSNEGYNVAVDNFTEKFNEQMVINNHANPLNSASTTKTIFCSMDSKIHLGSYLVFKNTKYIVINIPKDNDAYKSSEIELCDDNLKCILPNGKLINYPCVIAEAGRNNLRVETDKFIMMQSSEFYMIAQNNDDTIKIPLSYRFLFGKFPYIILDIDDVTSPGNIRFKVKVDAVRQSDNMNNNGLADQSVIIIPTTPTNLSISGSTSVKISTSSNYTILNNVSNTFSWSIVDAISGLTTSSATITSSTTTTCTIKGGTVAGKQVKLLATCIEIPTTVLTIILTVSGGF